ncbi:MAG TPA: RNA polymerase sigma factor [candidate division WOR-3 bacterium]|uniref:RNA polymerase sigma factor n=1 Tax=candidate division WOR-3 bacterium TaxID=2052148 RepID=A0A7C0ZAN4_UNCW3|nr:RNA polymerase sigma factor [candidate division WOR-3 bacterium]
MDIDLNLLRKQNEKEFERFFHQYIHRIYTIIYRVVGERATAEDLTLEVMMKVYKNIKGFKGEAKLSTWVYRIAYNHSIEYMRKNKKLEPLENINHGHSEDPLENVEKGETEELVREMMLRLPEKQRVALTLFYYDDMSYKEIAHIMGVDIGLVKNYIHRGKKKLKEYLKNTLKGVYHGT